MEKASAELLLEFGTLAVPYSKQENHADDYNVKFGKSEILKILSQKH